MEWPKGKVDLMFSSLEQPIDPTCWILHYYDLEGEEVITASYHRDAQAFHHFFPRFDRMLYLGVSDNHDSQLKIIQALTRKFKLDPSINLENVANICPFNYTGADFYALCSDAMLKAMTRVAEAVDSKIGMLII